MSELMTRPGSTGPAPDDPVPANGVVEPAAEDGRAAEGTDSDPDGADEWASAASFAQERLWFVEQLQPGSPALNILCIVALPATVTRSDVTAALTELVDRHEALRTSLRATDDGLTQVVHAGVPVAPEGLDLTGHPAEERPALLRAAARADVSVPLPVDHAPLWRARLVRYAEDEWRLLFVAHHSIFDAASMQILRTELQELCRARAADRPARLPELEIQYADFAAWQREQLSGPVLDEHLDYWRRTLVGAPFVHAVPTDRIRPPGGGTAGADVVLDVPPGLPGAVAALARSRRTTPFVVFLAAYVAVLSRLSGRTDVVIGVPVAGRDIPEVEPVIGMFVNTVVLRLDAGGDPRFAELVDRVSEHVRTAFGYADTPFQKIVEVLAPRRDPSVGALYQLGLNYLPGTGGGVGNGVARDDMLLAISDEVLQLEYNADLFDAGTARTTAERYLRLAAGAVAQPDDRLSELPLLEPGDLSAGPARAGAPDGDRAGPADLVWRRAAGTPDAPALTGAGTTLTYAQVTAAAERVAARLRAAGVGPGTGVAVRGRGGAAPLVAILGVLRAGGAFLAVDPGRPAGRLRSTLPAAGVSVLLGADGLLDAVTVETLDTDPLDTDPVDAEADPTVVNGAVPVDAGWLADDLVPLGAEVAVGPGDRVLHRLPAYADGAVQEWLWPLCAGAHVVLADPERHADAGHLRRLAVDFGVTVAHLGPALLAEFLTAAGPVPTTLRTVVCAGPGLSTPMAGRLFAAVPGCALVRGHRHAGRWATLGTVRAADLEPFSATSDPSGTAELRRTAAQVPVGRPSGVARLDVRDQLGAALPPGIPGELHVDDVPGDYPVRACWRDDGRLDLLGPGLLDGTDTGVVEAVLHTLPGVRDAAVRLGPDGELVAYVTGDVDVARLRTALAAHLPGYLIPDTVVPLGRMPLTPAGAVDPAALAAVPVAEPAVMARPGTPLTPMEAEVARIWAEVLRVEHVGPDDDFFDLGGHSMLAVSVVARMRPVAQAVGRPVGVMDLVSRRTVRALTALLEPPPEAVGAEPAYDPGVRDLLHRLTPPGPAEVTYVCVPYGGGSALVYQPLADALPAGHALYSLAMPGHDVGLDEDALPLAEMATRCVDEIVRRIPGPVVLYGHCGVGSALAVELAVRLEAVGRGVRAVYIGGLFPSPRRGGLWSTLLTRRERLTSNRLYANWLTSTGVDLSGLAPAQVERIVSNMRSDTRAAEDYFTGWMAGDPTRVSAPVIAVVGERDRGTEFYQERYREWHHLGDTAAVVVLDEGGHYFPRYRAAELAEVVTVTHTALADGTEDALSAAARGPDAGWWLHEAHRTGGDGPPPPPDGPKRAVPAGRGRPVEPSMGRFVAVAGGQLLSLTGTALTQWAVPVWIFMETGSYVSFALFAALGVIPTLLVSPLAGTLVDRYDRRTVMIGASFAAGGAELAMTALLWTGNLQIWHLYVLIVCLTGAGAVQRVGFAAATPQLVPKRWLGHANGVSQFVTGTANLVVPLVAAGVLGLIGLRGILVIDVLSYAGAIAVLLAVRFPDRMGLRRRETLREELIGGWRYVWQLRGFRALLGFFAVQNVLLGALLLMVTPLVLSFAGLREVAQAGFAEAVGAALGGLVIIVWGGPVRRRAVTVLVTSALIAVSGVVTGLRPFLPLIIVGAFGMGLWLAVTQGIFTTIVQVKVPQRFHGRVFALSQLIAWSTLPIGYGVVAPLAARLFDPLMAPGGALAGTAGAVLGTGPGRGIGLLYVVGGLLLVVLSVVAWRAPSLARFDDQVPDAEPDDLVGVRERQRRLATMADRPDSAERVPVGRR